MSSTHLLSGSCESYTRDAMVEHFKTYRKMFPGLTLDQFKALPTASMCDILLLERHLPVDAVEDVADALAGLALSQNAPAPNYVKQPQIKTMTECNPKPPFKWVSASKALGIPKGYCEKDMNWQEEKSVEEEEKSFPASDLAVPSVSIPQQPEHTESIFLPKDCDSYTLKTLRDHAKAYKHKISALSKYSKTDITKLDRQSLCDAILASRQRLFSVADTAATTIARAVTSTAAVSVDEPYLLDDLVCKDKKRLVDHMLTWKNKGYFPTLSESKIKRLNLDDLCNILFRSRVKKAQAKPVATSLPSTMIAPVAVSLFVQYPAFASVLDNMIQEILRVIASYIDYLAIPQMQDAPFGVREGYFAETVEFIESKTIIGPIVTNQLVSHICENVFPLAACSALDEVSIPELKNVAGSKYNNSNLEIMLQQKLSEKTKSVLLPILREANYKGFLTESGAKTLQTTMRKFSRAILYDGTTLIANSGPTAIYNRANNMWPRYDAFTFELNDKNKCIAALSWCMVSGTDWLEKQSVDLYDVVLACTILLGSYSSASAVIKKILQSNFDESNFEHVNALSLFRKLCNDAEVYPATDMLKRLAVCVHVITTDASVMEYLETNHQLEKFAQPLGGFMLSQQ